MSTAIDEFIAGRQTGKRAQPTHHRFVVTVFGLYGRTSGGAIPVAVVLRLLHEFGAEAPTVRSSISRLKKKGVLTSALVDGQRGYALTAELDDHFRRGDDRIFRARTQYESERWLLVSFSVPEVHRDVRHKIRVGLSRMGFGVVGPGLCIAPEHLREDAASYIDRSGLGEYVEFFVSEHAGPGDLKTKVAQWWDLDTLAAHYTGFMRTYQPVLTQWERADTENIDPRLAFQVYIPMVTEWRKMPFLDPGLPLDVLPAGWIGESAWQLFSRLDRILAAPAARYAQRAIHGSPT